MITHHNKTDPQNFNDILMGIKTFLLQPDDNNIKVGDTLYLYEWDTNEFTGRRLRLIVTYMLQHTEGLTDGYCIIGIKEYIK